MKQNKSLFPIERMAKLLRVSASGFYQHTDQNYDLLDEQITTVFKKHKGRCGSPRIYAELQRLGIKCSRYRVEKRMRLLSLMAGKKKRRSKTTISAPGGNDLLCRDFTAMDPNEKWCGDISYLHVKGGFVYLSVIIDLYSRKVVSWVVADHLEHTLVVETLEKALWKRTPPKGLIFHTDRGSQYLSTGVQELLSLKKIKSSQGLCAYDNAAMESFFGSLKAELLPRGRSFSSLEEAKTEVFEYIEVYYNKHRLHSTLGYMSPVEYEEKTKRPA